MVAGSSARAPLSALVNVMAWALTVLCLALSWVWPHAASASDAGIRLTDDRGVAVSLPRAPQRIVSLLPSLTETVCALGACDRIVGTDRYSKHPAQVLSVPKLGGLDDTQIERIVALKPDVVLLAVSARVITRLESLGLKVIALEPRSYADAKRVFGQLGLMLGAATAQRGEQVWRGIEQQLVDARAVLPQSLRGATVYFEVDGGPYAAGEVSFIGETLQRLGLRNIVPSSMGPFPKLSPEFVVRADPQWMILSAADAKTVAGRPGWGAMQAVKGQRVCALTADQGAMLGSPGPRIGEAAQVLARCLERAVAQARDWPPAAQSRPVAPVGGITPVAPPRATALVQG